MPDLADFPGAERRHIDMWADQARDIGSPVNDYARIARHKAAEDALFRRYHGGMSRGQARVGVPAAAPAGPIGVPMAVYRAEPRTREFVGLPAGADYGNQITAMQQMGATPLNSPQLASTMAAQDAASQRANEQLAAQAQLEHAKATGRQADAAMAALQPVDPKLFAQRALIASLERGLPIEPAVAERAEYPLGGAQALAGRGIEPKTPFTEALTKFEPGTVLPEGSPVRRGLVEQYPQEVQSALAGEPSWLEGGGIGMIAGLSRLVGIPQARMKRQQQVQALLGRRPASEATPSRLIAATPENLPAEAPEGIASWLGPLLRTMAVPASVGFGGAGVLPGGKSRLGARVREAQEKSKRRPEE